MTRTDRPAMAGSDLRTRYTAADVGVLTREEKLRFASQGDGDPQTDVALAWELLYRLEPELYDRLASAEHLHRSILDWLPSGADRIVEVGAGTGRLTLELVGRTRELIAIEPAMPLRNILERKLAATGATRARALPGFFANLPVRSDCAELVVACSAFTPASAHGGRQGLAEMERVCRPGGCVAIIWPNNIDWLATHGYDYVSFPGEMTVDFPSYRDAVELAEIFYPSAADEVRSRGERKIPAEVLGLNPPRDVAFKLIPQ